MFVLEKIKNIIILLEYKIYILQKRMKLRNRSPSILASNCNGAFILHDMRCRFNSPTVNLYFLPKDFIKFAQNPQPYLEAVPIEVKVPGVSFPVGLVNDILIFFMHFEDFESAKNKWIERAKRVDMDNIFVMMTERNGCTYEDIKAFDELPYKNKVVFTARPYPEISSAYYISGSDVGKEVGILSDFRPGFWHRRWLDDFDYVNFLNQ